MPAVRHASRVRRSRVLAALFVAVLTGGQAGASPLVLDAEGLAQGGQSALAGIDLSPASPRPLGWRFRIDGFEPYAGTGLVAAAVAAEHAGARFGAGFGFVTLWSPVGVVREIDTGLQLRHHDVIAGFGMQARAYDFAGYPTIWESEPRAGIGWSGGAGYRFATVVERSADVVPHPRLCAAIEASTFQGIRLALQVEREPGLVTRASFGVVAGESPFRLLAGFDVATQSCSVGFAWSGERQGIAWGARTHPVLGWSHAWTYERSY